MSETIEELAETGESATIATAEKAWWEDRFLAAFREAGNIRVAAQAAGIDRTTVWRHKEKRPAFRERYEEARLDAVDVLDGEARRRAVVGVDEPVFFQGKIAGHIRRYSDTLLIFLLKSHDPETYRDPVQRLELAGRGGGPIEHEHHHRIELVREQLTTELAARAARRRESEPDSEAVE